MLRHHQHKPPMWIRTLGLLSCRLLRPLPLRSLRISSLRRAVPNLCCCWPAKLMVAARPLPGCRHNAAANENANEMRRIGKQS